MRKTLIIATALVAILTVALSGAAILDKASDAKTIKTGVVFLVPMSDGRTAPARCEVIDGDMRLTVIVDNQFVDFLVAPWVTPDPPVPPPDPPDPPDVNPYTPDAAYQPFCEAVTKTTMERDDATNIAKVYADLASEVSKPDSKIVMSSDLRTEIVTRAKVFGLQGKYPAPRVAIEKAMDDCLTLENRTLNKTKTSAFLTTLAWAVWETGGKQ